MTALKSLTFAPLPKLTAADPVIWRRNKLIARLQQQVQLASKSAVMTKGKRAA